jgi:CheY-like chemotaxis protein
MSDQKSLLAGRQLLIVDDEEFSRLFVVRMVRELGCANVLQAGDGTKALQELATHGAGVAVVVLDFNMPGANGLQVLKAIRTGQAGAPRDTNVLMLTGSSDFGLVGAAMAMDVDAFVIKPVSLNVLTDRLTKMLRDPREMKPAEAYEAVDVDTVGSRLMGRAPVATLMPKPKARATTATATTTARKAVGPAKPLPGTKRVEFDQLTAGLILAEHIRGPRGELLLGAATVLTERLLSRLKELQPVIRLEYVSILVKPEDTCSVSDIRT